MPPWNLSSQPRPARPLSPTIADYRLQYLSSLNYVSDMARTFQSLCVYCGSSVGASPSYAEAARELARTLAAANINLVYGGGNIGLMGTIANEMLELGMKVTGVIPQALMRKEV